MSSISTLLYSFLQHSIQAVERYTINQVATGKKLGLSSAAAFALNEFNKGSNLIY